MSHEAARGQAETMRLLLEGASQGILAIDDTGRIVEANAALEAMLGWPNASLAGHPLSVVIPAGVRDAHAGHVAQYRQAPAARPMGVGLNLLALRHDGTTLPVEISLNYVDTSQGRLAFAFVTDISVRRRTEEALAAHTRELAHRARQLQRLASELTLTEQHTREQLAKTLHDHLQQILFSGRLKLDRLAMRLSSRADADARLLEQVRGELDEAIAATRSLAKELFVPTLHDSGLGPALTWLADWARDRYGLRIELRVEPAAHAERRDVRTLVFESVKELLFNVAKHARATMVSVELLLAPDGGIALAVADDGVGFDPADVFDPSRAHGTGLGLFSIRERLALFGGRLEVETAPGKGSRFTILMAPTPGLPPLVDRPAVSDLPAATASRPLRILVADDHPLVRDGLRQLFAEHEELAVVGEASNGAEAVALADAYRPDVVVMDVSMPQMSGVEATRRIHVMHPAMTIFGLSTEERRGTRHPIEDAGATDYFTKGDDSNRLLQRLLSLQASLDTPGPRA